MVVTLRQEFFYPSACGNAEIFGCIWREEALETYKGLVQLAHGMAEHILRYHAFAVFLAKRGFVVFGNDHRGHGKSIKDPEEHGFFGEQDGCIHGLVEDMLYLTQSVKRQYPKVAVVLIGHSMGSFLARAYVHHFSEHLKGAVFLGTASYALWMDALLAYCRREAKKHGCTYRDERLYKFALRSFNLKYIQKRTEYDWVCSDSAVVDAFMEDVDCRFLFTVAGLREIFLLLKEISAPAWGKAIASSFPMLFLSGKDDPVGEYGFGIERLVARLEKEGFSQITWQLYEGMRHELLNERHKETIYEVIVSWIQAVIKEE